MGIEKWGVWGGSIFLFNLNQVKKLILIIDNTHVRFPNGINYCSKSAQNQLIFSQEFFRKCCQNVVKMLSKRCHFQRVLKMLSKCCQNVVKMLSFLCLIFSSFSAHFTLKEKCGKFIIRNVVKMLSFFGIQKGSI